MDSRTFTSERRPPGGPEPTSVDLADRRRARGHTRWWRPEGDPRWSRPALLVLLVLTAGLYLWNLTASGWANAFYSAAVQAGSESWTAFFYGSSDAANSITVDKTPAALWVMALSVRLFGLTSASILVPEVLMGVASVGLLAVIVKRSFGAVAGLVAGATLALTPVAAMMFRFNNPDALLTLVMVVGAWGTLRAVERGSWRWLAFVGAMIGLGFLTKMLQAVVIVPAFALTYLIAARTTFLRRLAHLFTAGVVMVVTAGWWVAVVELVPASARPYIGGSQHNSVLELIFGYNGFGRLTGNETGSVGGGRGGAGGQWGETGLLRMFNPEIGGQVSWLIPSALVLLLAGLWVTRRAPRTDPRRAALVLWGGWLLVTGLTFSLMGGIFHPYYTVALAPAIGALVASGGRLAWEHRGGWVGTLALCAATLAAALWSWELLDRTPDWHPWLKVAVLASGLAAVLMLLVGRLSRWALPVGVATALAVALAGPTAYTLSTVNTAHTGSIPSAGPSGQGGFGPGPQRAGGGPGFPGGGNPFGGANGPGPGQGPGQGNGPRGFPGGGLPGGAPSRAGGMGGLLDAQTPSTEVVTALSKDASQYRWVAAAIGSQNAAGLQLATQFPVMAIGGFNGTDPSPTLAQFKAMVAAGQIHYFVAGGMGGPGGGQGTGSSIEEWVTENFTEVTVDGTTLYDLTTPLSDASDTTPVSGV